MEKFDITQPNRTEKEIYNSKDKFYESFNNLGEKIESFKVSNFDNRAEAKEVFDKNLSKYYEVLEEFEELIAKEEISKEESEELEKWLETWLEKLEEQHKYVKSFDDNNKNIENKEEENFDYEQFQKLRNWVAINFQLNSEKVSKEELEKRIGSYNKLKNQLENLEKKPDNIEKQINEIGDLLSIILRKSFDSEGVSELSFDFLSNLHGLKNWLDSVSNVDIDNIPKKEFNEKLNILDNLIKEFERIDNKPEKIQELLEKSEKRIGNIFLEFYSNHSEDANKKEVLETEIVKENENDNLDKEPKDNSQEKIIKVKAIEQSEFDLEDIKSGISELDEEFETKKAEILKEKKDELKKLEEEYIDNTKLSSSIDEYAYEFKKHAFQVNKAFYEMELRQYLNNALKLEYGDKISEEEIDEFVETYRKKKIVELEKKVYEAKVQKREEKFQKIFRSEKFAKAVNLGIAKLENIFSKKEEDKFEEFGDLDSEIEKLKARVKKEQNISKKANSLQDIVLDDIEKIEKKGFKIPKKTLALLMAGGLSFFAYQKYLDINKSQPMNLETNATRTSKPDTNSSETNSSIIRNIDGNETIKIADFNSSKTNTTELNSSKTKIEANNEIANLEIKKGSAVIKTLANYLKEHVNSINSEKYKYDDKKYSSTTEWANKIAFILTHKYKQTHPEFDFTKIKAGTVIKLNLGRMEIGFGDESVGQGNKRETDERRRGKVEQIEQFEGINKLFEISENGNIRDILKNFLEQHKNNIKHSNKENWKEELVEKLLEPFEDDNKFNPNYSINGTNILAHIMPDGDIKLIKVFDKYNPIYGEAQLDSKTIEDNKIQFIGKLCLEKNENNNSKENEICIDLPASELNFGNESKEIKPTPQLKKKREIQKKKTLPNSKITSKKIDKKESNDEWEDAGNYMYTNDKITFPIFGDDISIKRDYKLFNNKGTVRIEPNGDDSLTMVIDKKLKDGTQKTIEYNINNILDKYNSTSEIKNSINKLRKFFSNN